MKKNRLFAAAALLVCSAVFAGCGFGSDDAAEQVIVEETPTPEPTQEPTATPTPTIGPDIQNTTYTSADRSISFELPDATWGSKQDNAEGIIVESPEEGKIYITYQSQDSMGMIPDTLDMAGTMEKSEGLEEGEFEIQDYIREAVNTVEVTEYLVKYLNTEKTGGITERVWKYFVSADQSECYIIEAQILQDNEELIAKVKASVDSFKILSDSQLAAATADSSELSAAEEAVTGGSDDSQAKGGFTDEQLADTNQTRTVYSNTTGKGFVVTPNGDGTWADNQGNTYRFADDGSTVYDQNDVDYYYHGEAGDVYYMPVE